MADSLPRSDVSDVLLRWRQRTPEDEERLFAAVQREFRQIAAAYMRRERADHSPSTHCSREREPRPARGNSECYLFRDP